MLHHYNIIYNEVESNFGYNTIKYNQLCTLYSEYEIFNELKT